ncbi:Uncharacterised protein [uncultured archaeon]|nr:Uncharacterised protein [uncultured archaeon]
MANKQKNHKLNRTLKGQGPSYVAGFAAVMAAIIFLAAISIPVIIAAGAYIFFKRKDILAQKGRTNDDTIGSAAVTSLFLLISLLLVLGPFKSSTNDIGDTAAGIAVLVFASPLIFAGAYLSGLPGAILSKINNKKNAKLEANGQSRSISFALALATLAMIAIFGFLSQNTVAAYHDGNDDMVVGPSAMYCFPVWIAMIVIAGVFGLALDKIKEKSDKKKENKK